MRDDYLEETYWNGLIKMSVSKLFVLWALTTEELHGYAVARKIAAMTDGCCSPTEGALYPTLKQFEQDELVTSTTTTVGGRQRRIYTLTDRGHQAYKVGVQAWHQTAQVLVTMADAVE